MEDLIKSGIEKEAGIVLASDWHQQFVGHIRFLIDTDFEKLVYLLYRIDVSEQKIKELLDKKSTSDAGEIIANAIIERQKEKLDSRKRFKFDETDSKEEKW
jgi:hypothetical protein